MERPLDALASDGHSTRAGGSEADEQYASGGVSGRLAKASAIAGVAAVAAGGAVAAGDELVGDVDDRAFEAVADPTTEVLTADVPRLEPLEDLVVDAARDLGAEAGEVPGAVSGGASRLSSALSYSTGVAPGETTTSATTVAARGGADDTAARRVADRPRSRGSLDAAPVREPREGVRERREVSRVEVLDAPAVSGPDAPDAGELDATPPGTDPLTTDTPGTVPEQPATAPASPAEGGTPGDLAAGPAPQPGLAPGASTAEAPAPVPGTSSGAP